MSDAGYRHDEKVRCPDCSSVRLVNGHLATSGYPVVDGMPTRTCLMCNGTAPKGDTAFLKNRRWLEEAYGHMSIAAVAQRVDCNPRTVRWWLLKHGIPIRSRSEALILRHMTASGKRLAERRGKSRQMVTAGVGVMTVVERDPAEHGQGHLYGGTAR